MKKCSAYFGSSGLGLSLVSSGLGLGLVSSDFGLVTRGLANITGFSRSNSDSSEQIIHFK